MELRFSGEIWWWRGPAPFHFVTVPEVEAEMIHDVASLVTYGWGMIPVTVRIGETTIRTSLWPKDSGYVVPIKKALQEGAGVGLGDTVDLRLTITGGAL